MKNIFTIIIVIFVVVAGFWIYRNKVISKQDTVNEKQESQTSINSNNIAESGGQIHNLPIPDAVKAVRKHLAVKLGIEEDNIVIMEALEDEWPDACLGLPAEDEMCAQVITSGYNVLLITQGKEYRYRTNSDGTVIKLASTTDNSSIFIDQ